MTGNAWDTTKIAALAGLIGAAAVFGATITVKAGFDGDGWGPLPVVGYERAPSEVEYVKICSQYGAGFYYIPGTDTCVKIGGYIRADLGYNAWAGNRPFYGGLLDTNNAALHTSETASGTGTLRASVGGDFRTSTSYGTWRTFVQGAVDTTFGRSIDGGGTDGAADLTINRAFAQFAGFTAGEHQSYFDPVQRGYSYNEYWARDPYPTTAPILGAYTTPKLWGGLSASLSFEQTTFRRNAIWNTNLSGLGIGTFPGPSFFGPNVPGTCMNVDLTATNGLQQCLQGVYGDNQFPDPVANLRIDQSWGTAQLSGALHHLDINPIGPGVVPSDAWGYATQGSVVINLPWGNVPPPKNDHARRSGDTFFFKIGYSQGAPSYTGLDQYGATGIFDLFNGTNVAPGWALDGVFGTLPGGGASGLVLPQAFDIGTAVQHYWTPALRTSLFGRYTSWDATSTGNLLMCSTPGSPVRTLAGAAPTGASALPGCNFDFDLWAVGSRTVWSPIKNLETGIEVMYSKIDTKMDPNLVRYNFGGGFGAPSALYTPSNEGIWSAMFRVQRNFYP